MTTLGKILVFLVFLGALAVGGLMVYVARTTPDWKKAVDDRDAIITVLKANASAEAETRKKWVTEYEDMKKKLDANLVESKAIQTRLQLEADEKDKLAKEALLQQQKSDLNHKQAQQEATRLQKEFKILQETVQDRDKKIAAMFDEVLAAKNGEQAAKNEAETASARARGLLEQIKEKEAVIARLSRKDEGIGKITASVRDPNYKNPPTVYMKGQITAVDKDGKLVTISVGSDQGLKKDQTLEVFRTSPEPKYLGRIVIVDADFREAIGRLLPQPGMQAPVTLLPGDRVATDLR
jgi:hypothetical protein